MKIAASLHPVTYAMEAIRSLILEDFNAEAIGVGLGVLGVLAILMLVLNVRSVNSYD